MERNSRNKLWFASQATLLGLAASAMITTGCSKSSDSGSTTSATAVTISGTFATTRDNYGLQARASRQASDRGHR